MLLFSYASLLIVGLIIIIYLNKIIYKITSDFTIVITSAVMYYWGIAGAWFLVPDQILGEPGKNIDFHYYYIFEKLFKVSIDWNYLIAILSYTIFIIAFLVFFLLFIKRKNVITMQISKDDIPLISPYVIFICTCILIALSIFIMRREMFYALTNSKSVYLITRNTPNRLKTLHQLCNNYLIFIPMLSMITGLKYSLKSNFLNYFSIFLAVIYLTFLGNRHEIIFCGIYVLLILGAFYKSHQINLSILIKPIFVLFFTVLLSDPARSIMPKLLSYTLKTEISHSELKELEKIDVYASSTAGQATGHAISNVIFSNEMFFANFSMYGVLKKKVEPTGGSSFKWILKSLIPVSVYGNRGDDIYEYYAKSVNAEKGQGYSIYYSTAWYLNFGFVGIVLASLFLALIFGVAYFIRSLIGKINLLNVNFIIYSIPALLAAQMPSIIRSGPENMKSIFFEALLFPLLIILGMSLLTKKINK
jgi:hypothetical protein